MVEKPGTHVCTTSRCRINGNLQWHQIIVPCGLIMTNIGSECLLQSSVHPLRLAITLGVIGSRHAKIRSA